MTRLEAADQMKQAADRVRIASYLCDPEGEFTAKAKEWRAFGETLDSAALDLEHAEEADRQGLEAELPDEVNRFVDDTFTRFDRRLYDAGFTQFTGNNPHAPMLRRMLRQSIVEALDGRENLLP